MKQPSKPANEEITLPASSLGRPRKVHPTFEGTADLDPLTARLTTLMRSHPGIIPFSEADLSGMDPKTKKELLTRFDEALGLYPAKELPVIPLE